jgi:hypothetical protein
MSATSVTISVSQVRHYAINAPKDTTRNKRGKVFARPAPLVRSVKRLPIHRVLFVSQVPTNTIQEKLLAKIVHQGINNQK